MVNYSENCANRGVVMEKWVFISSLFFFTVLISAGVMLFIFRNEIIVEQRITALFKNKNSKGKKKKNRKIKNKQTSATNLFKPIINKFNKQIKVKMSKQSLKSIERKIRDAGYPFNWSPAEFRFLQLVLGLLFFLIIFILLLLLKANYEKIFILALLSGIFGVLYPNYYLQAKKKQRVKLIEKSMADFFDMVTLSIEAGMGLDQALVKVCKQNKGPLSEEFLRTIDDMKLGKSRRDAFSDLRYRIPSNQFQSIMSSLIQADQLGIGMGKILRSLTIRIREHQREKAREQAMKAPVKMLFPMVFFIFPSLFIVLLGPLVIFLITKGLGY